MNQDPEKVQYFISLVDAYIDGKPNPAEKAKLTELIKEDAFLEEVLKQQVQARSNIRAAGEQELKKKFLSKFDPIVAEAQQNPKTDFFKWLLAALLLFGIVAAGLYHLTRKHSTSQRNMPAIEKAVDSATLQLAMVEDPSFDILRSDRDLENGAIWQQAVKAFSIKDYSSALEFVQQLESDNEFMQTNNGKLALMKGVASLKLKMFSESRSSLDRISEENPYYDQAEWYGAMIAYYSDNKVEAKRQLESINNKEGHYKKAMAFKYLNLLEE